MTGGARYEGMEPLPRGGHAIEIVTPEGTFDLHNDGYVESIAVQPPDTLSVSVRCTYSATNRARVRLRFIGVRRLSSAQYEDEPWNASEWEHLVDWGGRFELRTGTHEFEFEAAAVLATVEPAPAMGIEPSAFDAAVEETFAPAMRRLGFEHERRGSYSARFDRPPVVVEVGYDATRSWELDVWVGRTDREATPVCLAHALRAAGCPEDTIGGLIAMQTGEPQVLRKLLARAAAALAGCGAESLREEGVALDRAFGQREEAAAAYELAQIAPQLIEEAEAAWAAKDLARLKELLDPVRDQLKPRDARRLAYAENRSV